MNTHAPIKPQSALANCIRALSFDAVEKANSGHPGAPMGMADAATVLYEKHLKFDASTPGWFDRDRVVLSNGHASMMLYSLLYLTGYPEMTIEEIENFRQYGSKTAGHPEYGDAPGIETTTGPLGQGIGAAVGMAIAERLLREQYGKDIVDHYTFVFCGDGCLMEGVGQEATSLAGHLKLSKLILLYDDNSISIDGPTSIAFTDDIPKKFEALGWRVIKTDGNDAQAVDKALTEAKKDVGKPTMIDMKTIIGYGAPDKQGTEESHGSPLGKEEIEKTRKALHWTSPPFVIPDELLNRWRDIGRRGVGEREKWQERVGRLSEDVRKEFERRTRGDLPEGFDRIVNEAKAKMIAEPKDVATRKGSQMALETLCKALPEMVGGSADLSGSTSTQPKVLSESYTPEKPARYIHYGVREFAMAAAINGMASHSGVIPYGGTYLTFSDYCRNAIRLSAIMGLRSIFVMTHDSIGLGEDGPTHQPIEQLASLRAMPDINVFRPCDSVETLECWALALKSAKRPSLFALSRQDTPQIRKEHTDENLCARGAYVIRSFGGERDVTFLSTGTEVAIAIEAAERLSREGFGVAVVSMPSWDIFESQTRAYRQEVLGSAPRLAIEAAGKFGWTRYVDSEDDVVGLVGFGKSAPAKVLYQKFGITADALLEKARAKLMTGSAARA
ncbi:MAG: transketolase [Pararhizobium sp.]